MVPGDRFTVDSHPNGEAIGGATGEGNAQAFFEGGAGNLVTKHNDLVQASYSLTLDELRLVLIAVSKVDTRSNVGGRTRYLQEQQGIFISAQEFASIFQLDRKNAYRQLRDAAGRLWERTITKIDGEVQIDLRWLYMKAAYSEGGVLVFFSPQLLDLYLLDLTRNFTSYHLLRISRLRSVPAIRLFEFCARFKDTGVVVTTKDQLCALLCVSYRKKSDLARRVIEPAVVSIAQTTGLDLTWHWKGDEGIELRFTKNSSVFHQPAQ
jgi:plasmid replication initiation protein